MWPASRHCGQTNENTAPDFARHAGPSNSRLLRAYATLRLAACHIPQQGIIGGEVKWRQVLSSCR